MASIGKIARRTFLIGSAAIAGGVAFGIYKVRQDPANPLADDLAQGAATFNPWVRIDATGITLITPHPDLGQGATSMQAALIAEEMDLDFGQFATDIGVPSAAYYNRALADDGVPFMSTDDSFVAEAARGVMGGLVKLMGAQVTGGSTSVPDSFDKLREAGAVARETLKAAASQQTGIAVGELTTASAAVVLPDGTRIAYADLAQTAAGIEPVRDVALRGPSQWRLIGKPMQRLDILAKSTGTQMYGIDIEMDGMVHATTKCNPRKGGAMLGYDASAAETMRGVKKILPVTNGVAVVADNTWRAFRAAEEITFDWGPAPYPAEQQGHWDAVGAAFTDDHLDREWRNDGDVDAALSGDVVEAEYRAPYVAHQPLEPLSAVALVTDDRADVWVCHQGPRFVQDRVAAMTGLAADQVHVHNQYAGGSFGHRLEFENIDRTVEIAMQMPGTPVKMTFRREEDFAQNITRHIGMSRARGAVAEGRVVACDLGIATPSVLRSQMKRLGQSLPGPDNQIPAGAWNLPYDLPNFRVRGYAVPELAPVSSWRSVGASTAGFFADSFLDELIHAAGADPMAERLRLCNDDVARKVLEAVAEMSDWGGDMGPDRGRGVALVNSFGVPVAEVVEVTNTDRGIRIDRVFVAADVGRIVDPVNFENNVQGAVIWGLGHAMNSEITYADGMAEQDNYHMAEGMRLNQCPEIIVRGLENAEKIRGIGEPPVPPAAPALANAIFAATGIRLREMPFYNHIDFA
ncbi:xanthine dehydrogenase family protein molybdopterin-binding subunit [Sulfitobacter sabulilitoris]|uniref:Xanthine dehydrogenase family protein molybdopterin-binding subunit n=1 Tax=Sulfitobacter sabulilitoris TaxID=2562655 RepID=A0A5S3PD67_9RHOB|nr:molybdopterin cofactor-binding domain-containing protein [Sulfitobacter sabulilitoris]TMM51814.1 xanthine dehydrogenase family protein molybdopterin-binding subunit [Sulfitobacter sabulilitoris]